MSPIPPLDYELLYQERVIRSVTNNTRQDGQDFLQIAAKIPIETRVRLFPLDEADQALNALKKRRNSRGSSSSDQSLSDCCANFRHSRAKAGVSVARTN